MRAWEQVRTKCSEVPELVPERHSTTGEERRSVPGAESRSFPLRRSLPESLSQAKEQVRAANQSTNRRRELVVVQSLLPREERRIFFFFPSPLRDVTRAGGESSGDPAQDDGGRGNLPRMPASFPIAHFGQQLPHVAQSR